MQLFRGIGQAFNHCEFFRRLTLAPSAEGVEFVIEDFHQPGQDGNVVEHAEHWDEIRDRIHRAQEIHQAGHYRNHRFRADGPVLATPVGQAECLQQAQIVLKFAQTITLARTFAGNREQQGWQTTTGEQAPGHWQEAGEIPGHFHLFLPLKCYPHKLWITL
ncbi:hypothetical protein EMIT0180MI3_360008 [Priestia megaterium]